MGKYFCLVTAIILCVCVKAQEKPFALIREDPAAFIFKRNHISFSLIPGRVQRAETIPESGPYSLGAAPGTGVEAGFNYHINFSKFYSLTIGLHGAGAERNMFLHIPKQDFSPPQAFDFFVGRDYFPAFDMYLKLPVTVQRRWFYGRKRFLEASAGISIGYYPDDILESFTSSIDNGNGTYTDILDVELETTQDFTPWIDYNIGVHHAWILKHYNLIRAGIVFNYSPVHIAEGSYTVTVPGKPNSTGQYLSRLSYIGVAASYAFTASHKSIRRIYEKEGRRVLGEFEY